MLNTVAVLAVTSVVSASDWPQWRGPLGTGSSGERGLPTKWNPEENVAWTAQLGGLGLSSPVVWKDRVFLTSQVGGGVLREGRHPTLVQESDPRAAGERPLGGARAQPGKARFVVEAFHRSDGRRLWEYALDAEGELPPVHEKHNLATSSAVTDGERVYALFGTGQLVALDVDGKLVWKRHLGADYSPFLINWGHTSSPVVYEDSLILACYHSPASYLLALDRRTGKQLWKVDRGKDVLSYSTPLIVQTAQRSELVLNTSEGIEAHDAATGERLWSYAEASRFPIPMPVHHEGTIYTSRGYRSGPYLAIKTGGSGDISKTHVPWKVATGAPYVSSLVHHDGLLYMAGDIGVVTCVDARTGERVWQERLGGVFSASPVAADGKIYLLSEGGETVVLEAGRTPRVLARNKLDGRLLASPAVSGGRLFIRTDDRLFAIGK
jgi:outer membrane protein assembly factor BamB